MKKFMRMRIKPHYLVIISALLLSPACKKWFNWKGNCGSIENAQSITYDGEDRFYILYVPKSINQDIAVPLLFNFHGYGGNAFDFMQEADMRALAERDTFILVYPQGSCLDGFSHWNAALPSTDNKSNTNDFGFINALIEELDANLNIDRERVYACGFSNGGFFSYALACHLSDKIAAVGSVGGTMLEIGGSCAPSHPTGIISIHGTNDNVVPYNGNADFNAIADVINFWTNFNGTKQNPIIETASNNSNYERYSYADGDSGVSVELYTLNGGGHEWFSERFNEATTAHLLWDFFHLYDINGKRN